MRLVTLKHHSEGWRLAVVLLHLAVFAQLGVLTRTFLGKFFDLGCSGNQWGPCLEGGIYFKDLPANMLGSFVIGLFAASSVLGLESQKALAILPSKHSWQKNLELQLGIRTGYCGSLTTFASWQLELMTEAINSNQWLNMVLGFIVGMYAAVFSYSVGCHVALLCDRWWLAEREDVLTEAEVYRSRELSLLRAVSGAEELGAAAVRALSRKSQLEAELEDVNPDLPRNVLTPEGEGEEEEENELSDVERSDAPPSRGLGDKDGRHAGGARHGSDDDGAIPGAAAAAGGKHAGKHSHVQRQAWTFKQLDSHIRGSRTDAAALVLLVCMTAALAIGVAIETQHTWLRTIWLECLFGPFGCFLRWYLSRFNYKLAGGWAWFPAGTFAANMLGTSVDFGLQCVLRRATLGYWPALLLPAVQTGFCGALTTVSTFVTEVVKFHEVFPERVHSYTYSFLSLGGGILLGVVIYGWAVWA